MSLSESQNLDAASQRIVRDMDKIAKGKLPWEDSQEYVTEGIGHLVFTADHTDKEVKSMHQTVKAMHTDMNNSNGKKVVFKSKWFSLTAGSALAFCRIIMVLFVTGASCFGMYIGWYMFKARKEAEKARIEAPDIMKRAFQKAICEDKHGPNCTRCVDHPH